MLLRPWVEAQHRQETVCASRYVCHVLKWLFSACSLFEFEKENLCFMPVSIIYWITWQVTSCQWLWVVENLWQYIKTIHKGYPSSATYVGLQQKQSKHKCTDPLSETPPPARQRSVRPAEIYIINNLSIVFLFVGNNRNTSPRKRHSRYTKDSSMWSGSGSTLWPSWMTELLLLSLRENPATLPRNLFSILCIQNLILSVTTKILWPCVRARM